MEKIKVNMSPNPLDVQAIHASQNDGEARQWEFELHNNGELIDTSEITEQLFFKAYKGGTEQLLPENTSTPTTSPFIGDIKYPQGLLTNQEFTYRQSPTESDGLAKITDIKGNTIVWNQLVQNGNFADSSNWVAEGSATINSITNNTINVTTANASSSGIAQISFPMTNGHKCLLVATIKTTGQTNISISGIGGVLFNTNSFVTKGSVFTWTAATGNQWSVRIRNFDANSATFEAKNVMLIDLTEMFGSGNEPTTIEDFTSLFSLPYYAYNQGTLLSFMGNGIKTVGKNLLNPDNITALDEITKTENGWSGNASNWLRNTNNATWQGFDYLPNVQYYAEATALSVGATWIRLRITYSDGSETNSNTITSGNSGKMSVLSTANKTVVSVSVYYGSNGASINELTDFAIMVSNSTNEYEPYTSSTLSLPISTYFPTGMKSAGSVYDELTENKAITRVGSVDLGTLRWTYSTDSQIFTSGAVLQRALTRNGICAQYDKIDGWSEFNQSNKSIFLPTNSNIVRIKDPGYTDATAFKSAMSGVYLYCELATESETSFTTASLVTENAEIPLSNEDGVLIGKCTEQLSSESGFIDAKIKLADEDGECYSNKIQLHIERSPQ